MKVVEYKPKAYVQPFDEEDIDIDDSNDGDYIVCYKHTDEIIYVFGTDFWRKEGGTCSYGWSSINIDGWCPRCQKTYRVGLGSYGG